MFAFKKFIVHQQKAAMKVGTDGVLLGAWTNIPDGCKRILDIGTGTGLIALMMAQRSPSSSITGVEADESSAEQASENAGLSEWSPRIEIVHTKIQDYAPDLKFDLIVSNPPYYDGTLICPNPERTQARHTVSLTFKELMASVERLITPQGRFSVIVPYESAYDLVVSGRLHLTRRCDIRTKPSKAPKRTLLEFSPAFAGAPVFEELSISDSNGGYTDRYRLLTSDFYLKL